LIRTRNRDGAAVLMPEIPKCWRQFGVAHGVLDIPVAQTGLQRPVLWPTLAKVAFLAGNGYATLDLSNRPSRDWRSPWHRVRCVATEKRRSRSKIRTRRKVPKRTRHCPACTASSNLSLHTRANTARSTSTTLADLLTPPLVAKPFAAVRASLRRWPSEEVEDGLAHGGQGRLRWRPVDSFFPA
jgi:hypothetical protein